MVGGKQDTGKQDTGKQDTGKQDTGRPAYERTNQVLRSLQREQWLQQESNVISLQ